MFDILVPVFGLIALCVRKRASAGVVAGIRKCGGTVHEVAYVTGFVLVADGGQLVNTR